MSVEKVRVFMEKSGCAIFVAIAIVLVLILGMARMGCDSNSRVQVQESSLIADIKGYSITSTSIDSSVQKALQQNSQYGAPSPEQELETRAKILTQGIDQGLILHLAKEKNISFNDNEIVAVVTRQFDDQVQKLKEQLVNSRELKKGFTQKDFDAIVKKKLQGEDINTIRTKNIDALKKQLNDPKARTEIEAGLAGKALVDKFTKSGKVTEQQVRESYKTLIIKLINISDESNSVQVNEKKANEIHKELLSGLSFDQAMEKYNKQPAEPGKKKSDSTIELQVSQINEKLNSLLSLKPNEISPVIHIQGQFIIFKLIKFGTKLPNDFDKKKIEYQTQYLNLLAQKQLIEELVKLRKNKNLIKWHSKPYELLYQYATVLQDPDQNTDALKRTTLLKDFAAKALKVESNDRDSKISSLLHFAATEQLWRQAKDKDRKSLEVQRINAINTLLGKEKMESVQLRLELTQMLLDKKDKAAGEALSNAAEFNNTFDMMALYAHSQIEALLPKLKAVQLVSIEQEKKINKELARWKKEKTENEAYQEKQRKEQEAAKKKMEEEEKNVKNKSQKSTEQKRASQKSETSKAVHSTQPR